MPEWSNGPDSKSGVPERVPRVRIPISPPSPAEAGYGGHSPLGAREGGLRYAVKYK